MKKKILYLLINLAILVFPYLINAQNVTLNYPKNGFVTANSQIELCWNYQAGNLYEIEVSLSEFFNPLFYSASNIASGKINLTSLNANTMYHWRVREISPIVSAWSNTQTFIQFEPGTINNLGLWLRADTLVTLNNSNVLTWKDLSSNQYTINQPILNNQPTLVQNFCNDKYAIKFDGNDFFEISNFSFGASNTVFVIGKKNAGGIYPRYVSTYGNNMEICTNIIGVSGNLLSPSYTTVNPSVISLVRTSSTSKLFLNDSLLSETNVNIPALSIGAIYFGKSNLNFVADFLNGEIAEIILCTTQLNDSVINLTNRYLMDKYSKALNLGNDTIINDNFCPISLSTGAGFNNILWSTGDTASNINVASSGTYWVSAKDFFGRVKYDTIQVQFPSFTQLSSQVLCYGNQITWNSGLNNNFTTVWQNNSIQNQITIDATGAYYFSATDSYGCILYSDTANVFMDNFSIENTLGNDTSFCFGNTLQLQNSSTNGLNYLWSTGSSNDTISISNSGQYWVDISNLNNCIFRDTITIIIAGTAPHAEFTAGNGCIGAPITFTDLSYPPLGDTIVQWDWDFGDGSFSSNQNNAHTYDSAGIYLVSLKVILQSGCAAIFNSFINVFIQPQISITSFNLCNGNATEFNNTSNLNGGSQISILWNFGDPSSALNTANTNQAFHNYNLPGTYVVQLTIETLEGCTYNANFTINIKPSPVANFVTSGQCLGDSTVFNDISQIVFPWQNLARKWFFNSTDTSFLYQPSFVFDSSGVYEVVLFVQSSNGCSDTIAKFVSISNKPVADLTFENNCKDTPAVLSDISTCTNCQIVNYNWILNNAIIGNTGVINYLFGDTGVYSITLEVQNNAGCTAFKDTTISVKPTPIANFTLNSNFGSPPFVAEFNNLSQFANTYSWDFGDDNFSSENSPIHTFTNTGTFQINLTAFNIDDCSSITSQIIKIQPKRIDLAVFDLKTTLIDDFISSEMIVFNKSNTIVSGFEINISNKSNIEAKESFENKILPGEFVTLKLSTKIGQGEGLNLSNVICVEITKVNEGLDDDLSNNTFCNALSADQFKLLNIFPNPSMDHIVLNFISPSKEDAIYEIINSTGNSIVINSIVTQKGYNQYPIATSSLAAGIYICKLMYKGSTQSLTFIKLN